MKLPDLQDEKDPRNVEIDEVGISGLKYPVLFDDGVTQQHGIADIEITVRLPGDRRGTHMSRMVQLVDEHLQVVDPSTFPAALKRGAECLDVDQLTIQIGMPFATQVTAPASQEVSWQVHQLRLAGQQSSTGVSTVTGVTTEVTSLCPCSKAISDYGAHNQRSRITLEVNAGGDQPYPFKVAHMAELIRSTSSCPVYPTVKRSDERVITMAAYDKPMFIEDIIRELSVVCRDRGLPHTIEARNLESIHSHDAISRLRFDS